MTNKQIYQQKEQAIKRIYIEMGVGHLIKHVVRVHLQALSLMNDLPETNYSKESKEKANQELKNILQTIEDQKKGVLVLDELLKPKTSKKATDSNKTKRKPTTKKRQ